MLLWNVVPTHPRTAASNRPPDPRRDRRSAAVSRRADARPAGRRGRARRGTQRSARRTSVTRRTAARRRSRRACGVHSADDPDVRRNAFLLAGGSSANSGMFQLAAALSSLTLVAVTGIKGVLGLGPAIFLTAGAIAVGPAGRSMDRVGRMPVIRGGFVGGAVGCGVVALGCSASRPCSSCVGLALVGAWARVVQLSRAAAAEMFPPDRRARGMSFVLFGAVSGAVWGPSSSARSSRTARSTPHALVARGSSASRSCSPGSRSRARAARPQGRSPRAIRRARERRRAGGAAAGDPAPAGRRDGDRRGRRELRGHGVAS